MLACIGEAFEHDEEVCGVVVSVRRTLFRISLWTRSSDNYEKAMSIGYCKNHQVAVVILNVYL
jgi:translation initiation factor 4E